MNKLICANCGRPSDIGYYDYKSESGCIIGVVYLCSICKSLLKKIDLNIVLDDDKLQEIKKHMKLNKERIEDPPEQKKT